MKGTKRTDTTLYRKRTIIMFLGLSIIFIILAVKLFYIQILLGEELSQSADDQHKIAIQGLDSRGIIYDRNMIPLVGGENKYYYFIPKLGFNKETENLLASIDADDVTGTTSNAMYKVFRTNLYNNYINSRLKEEFGAYVLMLKSRYSDEQTACHLIGYINQDEEKGKSGIELICDNILGTEKYDYNLSVDGAGKILKGIAPVKSERSEKRNNVVLTLDSRIQNICEQTISEAEVEGAVIVSDVASGEILGWASAPVFNPNMLEEYLEKNDECLIDKNIQGVYPPGSVFKIVVAAAALENELINPSEKFECSGETEVNGVKMTCSSGPEDGHGMVDMYDAMAVSCNCYFVNLGKIVGIEDIIEMASKMGLGKNVFDAFGYETKGNLPDTENLSDTDLCNLAIGQGYLLTTPAQIQKIMSIIAGNGVYTRLKLIKDGNDSLQEVILSEKTALQIEAMMEEVMDTGTGANSNQNLNIFGKTGTAEAYEDDKKTNHCWCSGYIKYQENIIAITVLVENGVSGSISSLPLFNNIAEGIVSTF